MLIEGVLLLDAPPRGVRLSRGWLRVSGGRIAELSPGSPPGPPDWGSASTLVLPGFVDAHAHLPQFECIGVDGLPLLEWLERAVFPVEIRWADPDHAGDAAARAASRFLACGTTGVAAYATVHHEAAQTAIEALNAAGMCGMVGQVLTDQQVPPELARPADQLLKEAAGLAGRGRIGTAITPRFAVSCSEPLLRGAGDLARRTGSPIQTHLGETPEECRLVERLHGAGYAEVYARTGLLTGRTVLAHGIWLDDADRSRLAAAGSVIAHCPTANLFLQAGTMDRDAHARAGVRSALGSDVAGGPDVSMPRVARAMIETAKRLRMQGRRVPLPTAAEAWWQITAGNAAALGLHETGRLVEGNWADLVLADPTSGPFAEPAWECSPEPLSTLLYAWDERWISRTLAAGRVVYAAP